MAFDLYKRGQGYYTRVCTAISGGVITALGCSALYDKLDVLQGDNKFWIQAGIPVVVLLVIVFTMFKFLNTPKFADFLIATEGEMKKVTWATKKEVYVSTTVVIVTLLAMALTLFAVDLGLGKFFQLIY